LSVVTTLQMSFVAYRVEAMDDFADFYAARKDAVLRAVTAATGDRPGAEDAVAEAFTRAYSRWARVTVHPSPTAWVVRVALNVYRSGWRRLRRERSSEAVGDARQPGGEQGTGTGRLDVDLRRLVATLPKRQREVVALRVLADLSAEQAGAVLGIRTATVHVHLHRALDTLRRAMPSNQGERR
jgi:RNA polymerase sigma-70 factor (ECF subfamily)